MRRTVFLFECTNEFERQVFQIVIADKSAVHGRIFYRLCKVYAACFHGDFMLLFVPLIVDVFGRKRPMFFCAVFCTIDA